MIILDKIDDFALYHEELCIVMAVVAFLLFMYLLVYGIFDVCEKYNDKSFNYRVDYTDDKGRHCKDWTNEIEEKDNWIIYIDEDNHKKKLDLDTAIVTDLKEWRK